MCSPVYKYYLLGSRVEFDSYRACAEFYARNPSFALQYFSGYGLWIVRQNIRTGRCVAFEFVLSNIKKTFEK